MKKRAKILYSSIKNIKTNNNESQKVLKLRKLLSKSRLRGANAC